MPKIVSLKWLIRQRRTPKGEKMPIVIRRVKKEGPGLPYADWPITETRATKAQEKRIAELRKKNPGLEIVPHSSQNKFAAYALVAINDRKAVWISPKGRMITAKPVYPFCYGNPTTAHCIANGYCRRSPACSE